MINPPPHTPDIYHNRFAIKRDSDESLQTSLIQRILCDLLIPITRITKQSFGVDIIMLISERAICEKRLGHALLIMNLITNYSKYYLVGRRREFPVWESSYCQPQSSANFYKYFAEKSPPFTNNHALKTKEYKILLQSLTVCRKGV